MIKRLLIANRGEIACRIIRTARSMGIETVAVYSDIDRGLLHVQQADYAQHIGPSSASESYLSVDKIINAAINAGADAIHPGYGFLSENVDLANRCEDNNIVFVGPSAASIDAMGSKSTAKQLMEIAGVPLLPGYHGDDQDDLTLLAEADRCGYPVLIKASASGGGKGMRIVVHREDFIEHLASARREALSAFGKDQVIVEKYLEQPRHIEVQVFGDTFGNIVHLQDRDCSVQRRYQKVIEEAPAPNLDPKKRKELHNSAIRAAKSINYLGAGTVEFICSSSGDCYFMEMNTRLQVEHPVTEAVTGLDLVEWQLRIASGEAIPLSQQEIEINGHAVEARIYAEDPYSQFLPSTGTLSRCEYPEEIGDVRVDCGFHTGDSVSIYYDPMIAKIIAHSGTRDSAIAKLHQSLSRTCISGVKSNVDFLMGILEQADFIQITHSTAFLDTHLPTILDDRKNHLSKLLAIASVYLHSGAGTVSSAPSENLSPWAMQDNWRLNTIATRLYELELDNLMHTVMVTQRESEYSATIEDSQHQVCFREESNAWGHFFVDGQKIEARVFAEIDGILVHSTLGHVRFTYRNSGTTDDSNHEASNTIKSPMPGKVIAILTGKNANVKKGQALVTLEAMKMEHTLSAASNGVVTDIRCAVNDTVTADTILIELDSE